MVTFSIERNGTLPLIPYHSEDEMYALSMLSNLSNTVAQSISLASNGWVLVGTTYLISNLFVFTHILALYNYLQLQWVLTPYKLIINNLL